MIVETRERQPLHCWVPTCASDAASRPRRTPNQQECSWICLRRLFYVHLLFRALFDFKTSHVSHQKLQMRITHPKSVKLVKHAMQSCESGFHGLCDQIIKIPRRPRIAGKKNAAALRVLPLPYAHDPVRVYTLVSMQVVRFPRSPRPQV